MKTALVVIYNHSHFRELIRTARLLQADPGFSVVAVFEYLYDEVDADIDVLAAAGIPCYATDGTGLAGTGVAAADLDLPPLDSDPVALLRNAMAAPRGRTSGGGAVASSVRRVLVQLARAADAVLDRWITQPVRQQRRWVEIEYATYLGHIERTERLLRRLQPDVVLFGEITLNYPTGFMWIELGHAHGAASVIIPFGLMGLPYNREMVAMYADDPTRQVRTPVERLAARQFPSMVQRHDGKRVLRMELTRTVASGRLGLIPPMPWIPNSCNADAIAVESKAMLDLYRRAGFPSAQLRLVGAPYNDALTRSLSDAGAARSARCDALGFDPERPLIICGFPPDQFGTTSFGAPIFGDYEEVIRFTAETFAAFPDANFVVNPHPRMHQHDFSPLAGEANVQVSYDSIVDLIPLGDVYLAAASSSTIRLALACGKPVVNFDVYGYRHPQFTDVPGVIEVDSAVAYRAVLTSLLCDAAFLARQQQLVEGVRQHWGELDGHAGPRLLDLFEELTGSKVAS